MGCRQRGTCVFSTRHSLGTDFIPQISTPSSLLTRVLRGSAGFVRFALGGAAMAGGSHMANAPARWRRVLAQGRGRSKRDFVVFCI